MQSVAFIINPFSAKKDYRPFLQELKKKVENPLYYISESILGTEDFIKKCFDEVEIFVAIGGDGTISTVAKTIIGTDKILAIFPAGSGNGFSNETHFDKNLDHLLAKIKEKKSRKIDTFTVNGRLSINVSGTGFDGKVGKEFEKTSRGFFNYIRVSIQTFFRCKPIEVRFGKKEYQSYSGRYLMVNIANTRQFGNHAYIAPKAKKSDGLVDVVLVKKFPVYYSLLFVYRMFSGRLHTDDYVTYFCASEFDFEVSTENWHLDGEFNKIESPVSIKVQPMSLKILV